MAVARRHGPQCRPTGIAAHGAGCDRGAPTRPLRRDPRALGGAAGLVARLLGHRLGIPVILGLPGGDLAADKTIGYGGRLRLRGRVLSRLALTGARRITVPSGFLQAQAAALGVETIRIPFGVALDRWPAHPPRPRSPDRPLRLLHVAGLNAVKDQATLLAAAAMLASDGLDYRLDIVGEDTLGGAIQALASRLGLDDRTNFHGFLVHAETRSWMDQADILVMSSRHEAGPLVTLEAAIAGVPTVGTAVGHIADWSPHAATAVPVGDSRALADAIAGLAADEPRRLRIATEAQRRALAEDADFTARQTRALYRSLVSPRP